MNAFGVFLLVALLVVASNAAAANCSGSIRVRKEFRDLTTDEWNRVVNAINKLASMPSVIGQNGSRYHDFAAIHTLQFHNIHFVDLFLPWHRAFTLDFENTLRSVDPSIVLPYWDWTIDYAEPEKSPLFMEMFAGSSQEIEALPVNPESNEFRNRLSKCVPNGPFKNLTYTGISQVEHQKEARLDTKNECLKRGFNPKTGYSSGYWTMDKSFLRNWKPDSNTTFQNPKPRFANAQEISLLIQQFPNYTDFRNKFEYTYHMIPHVFVGGFGGTMSLQYSPSEPIFWLHHGFVDFIYHQYQMTYGKDKYPANEHMKNLPHYNKPIKDYFDIDQLCYKYQPSCLYNSTEPGCQKTPPRAPPIPDLQPTSTITNKPTLTALSVIATYDNIRDIPFATFTYGYSTGGFSETVSEDYLNYTLSNTATDDYPFATAFTTVTFSGGSIPTNTAPNEYDTSPKVFHPPTTEYPIYRVNPIPPPDRILPPFPIQMIRKYRLNATEIAASQNTVRKIAQTIKRYVNNGKYIPPVVKPDLKPLPYEPTKHHPQPHPPTPYDSNGDSATKYGISNELKKGGATSEYESSSQVGSIASAMNHHTAINVAVFMAFVVCLLP